MEYRIIATAGATDAELELVDAVNECLAAHETSRRVANARAVKLRQQGIACRVDAFESDVDAL